MNISIQELTDAEQIPALHTMTVLMATAMNETAQLNMQELKELFKKGAFKALIAYDDGQAVGYSVYSEGFHTFDGQFMYVDDIFVSENYRHNGIGGKLLSKLLEIAKQNNYSNIEWLVKIDNDELRQWYDSVGSKVLSKYEYRRLSST